MKKVLCFIMLIVILAPNVVFAQRGCCSHHGGVSGSCSNSGYQICNDGTRSPSCRCTPTVNYIYGCTDSNAINYNPNANVNDGSCISKKMGCTNSDAINYDASANTNDGSCQYKKTITEVEEIEYQTVSKNNEEISDTNVKVVQQGKNGKKEVIFEIITDETGKELHRNMVSEKIIEQPVDQIVESKDSKTEKVAKEIKETKDNNEADDEETSNTLGGVMVLSIVFTIVVTVYYKSHKDKFLVLGEIYNLQTTYRLVIQIMLVILYVMFMIPAFVDLVLILKYSIKKK